MKIADLATGHYARIEAGRLKRARDKTRDQSYFLYGAPREHLTHLHFPLGDLAKTEVRRIASSRGVFVAAKPDSMELCFAAEDDYRRALSDVPAAPGPIRDLEGKRLGEHQGIHNFTIGQRRGLGISSADRLYVVDLLPAENTVVVGTREQGTKSVVRATLVNVLLPEALCTGAALLGKIRSVGEPEPCRTVALTSDAVEVVFDPPVFGPAPGQHLVLYDAAETVVAGGVIESAEPAATQ